MIDKQLLNNLDENDKDNLISTLDTLINQTYAVEEEYKSLRESYDGLQDIIGQIIESLPNAIWVINDSGEVFLQNTKAKSIVRLMGYIDFRKNDYGVKNRN